MSSTASTTAKIEAPPPSVNERQVTAAINAKQHHIDMPFRVWRTGPSMKWWSM